MNNQNTKSISNSSLAKIVQGVALAFACSTVLAGTLTPRYDPKGFVYINLDGKIEASDPARLLDALSLSRSKGLPVWGVVLQSPGGSVEAGLQLASIIRQNKLSTMVGAKSLCASACFYLFAAGVNRVADTTATVGVHSAAEDGIETDRAAAATIRFSRVLATLNVPDSILGKIVKTPPRDVYYLSPQDLASMGVQFVATPASSIQNLLADAGLKRSELDDVGQDRKRARELNQRGVGELRSGNVEQAVASLANAATLSPFDAEILGNLGYAQYLQGAHEAALGSLLTALKVQPGRALTLQNIGLVYAELNNFQLAAQYFLEYIRRASSATGAVEVLKKWASDPSASRRAQAASLALGSLASK